MEPGDCFTIWVRVAACSEVWGDRRRGSAHMAGRGASPSDVRTGSRPVSRRKLIRIDEIQGRNLADEAEEASEFNVCSVAMTTNCS